MGCGELERERERGGGGGGGGGNTIGENFKKSRKELSRNKPLNIEIYFIPPFLLAQLTNKN